MNGALERRALSRPSQIKFVRPAQMELFAKIVSFPPLGQLTVTTKEQRQIEFTVLLEASRSLPEGAWEASIWHNCPTKSNPVANIWKDLPLFKSTSRPFGTSAPDVYHYTFTAAVELCPENDGGALAHFTIKYRAGPNGPWQWVKDQFGTPDGSLLRSYGRENRPDPPWPSSIFGGHYLQEWDITPLSSQAPSALLFKVESKDFIPRDNIDDVKFKSKVFGSSHAGFCRYMALVRIWTPWLAPRHGECRFRITEDALMCAFLTSDGQHTVLLPINGVNDMVTVFRSDEQGHILVAARNDGIAEAKFEFLAATADEFETANAAVMYEARNIILKNRSLDEQGAPGAAQAQTKSDDSNTVSVSKDDRPGGAHSKPGPQWFQTWYDGLTYCTWNSLGQDLTAQKLLAALGDLAANNIHVSGLIIDDNWQSLDGMQGTTSQFQRGWTDFEANHEGFPNGLKSTITKVKAQHPAIENIAVWHGLHGYWGGISRSGRIAENYKTIEVEKQAGIAGGRMLAVDPSDIHRMYDDFYAFLSSCGITSVKADVQFYLDMLASTPDRRAFTTAYQAAWTTAHLRHFAGKAISCMSQIPQILFHSFLPTNTPRILLRNSDDFFPSIPASHPWHVFCNAHNALFVQHLNVLPDWDMFQTTHPYSGFHAAARCVSGGPIYITDTPGEHDLDLIAQMTAENVRGQTVILRPSVVGKTIGIYDQYHEGHILKVGTYHGRAQTGNGILGLFNVSDHEISAMVPITDFPGVDMLPLTTGDEKSNSAVLGSFIIRSHVTEQISNLMTPSASSPSTNLSLITLPIRGYDILTAHPVYDFSTPASHDTLASSTSIAVLGLLGKMTGASAITSSDFKLVAADALRMYVSLKALGTLGVWISNLDMRSINNGFLVIIHGQVMPRGRVKKRILDAEEHIDALAPNRAGVLEIDVLGAWRDMELDSGWSNEVTVEIHMQGHDRQREKLDA